MQFYSQDNLRGTENNEALKHHDPQKRSTSNRRKRIRALTSISIIVVLALNRPNIHHFENLSRLNEFPFLPKENFKKVFFYRFSSVTTNHHDLEITPPQSLPKLRRSHYEASTSPIIYLAHHSSKIVFVNTQLVIRIST